MIATCNATAGFIGPTVHGRPSIVRSLCQMALAAVTLASIPAYAGLKPSQMSLALFQSGRIKEPTVFQVKIRLSSASDYVHGMPVDERDKYWALMAFPDGDKASKVNSYSGVLCFAQKDSDVGKAVVTQLGDGALKDAYVSLHYTQRGNCVIMDALELIADNKPNAGNEIKEGRKACAISVKFGATKIALLKNDDFDWLNGKIEVQVNASSAYFKRPVCRVVLLTDENGTRVVRDCIMNGINDKEDESSGYYSYYDRNTYKTPPLSSVFKHTTTMGDANNKPFRAYGLSQNATSCRSAAEISAMQPEVSKEECKKISFDGIYLGQRRVHGMRGYRTDNFTGYALLDKKTKYRVLGYRIEIWHDGVCAGVYDSIKPALAKRFSLPEDWHVSFKHPQKIMYRAPIPVNVDR